MDLYSGKKTLITADEVVEYILSRKQEELETLSVGSIACSLKVNRRKLSRCFKSEMKMTLEKYIFRIRILHAAILLREREDLSVKEIGQIVGYYSYNYFIHIFKQYMGTTPGKYRGLMKDGFFCVPIGMK
jgi:transcriptional regulator GlxA family with amidase domain